MRSDYATPTGCYETREEARLVRGWGQTDGARYAARGLARIVMVGLMGCGPSNPDPTIAAGFAPYAAWRKRVHGAL